MVKKTNRRRLLQGAVAASAGIALGHGERAPFPVTAASPGEELRVAMQALPPQLDPQTDTWIVMGRVYCMAFDTLITRDWANGGALIPGLAESWAQIDDSTIEFTLREGVVFQDGSPLTAKDVKFTLERSLAGNPRLSVTGQYPIQEITVQDDLHFTIKTDGPRGGFPLKLAGYDASIVSEAYFNEVGYEAFQQKPLGTGPYRVTEFVPDQHILLEANARYWGGSPVTNRVRITGIPEVSTRIAALLNDEVDLITDLPPDQVQAVTASGDYAITDVAPLNANIYQAVNIPPTDKKEVRQALSLGVDRQAIVEQLLGGYGVWPTGIQSTTDPLYSERPLLPYDPEKAKALLQQANYTGEEIKLAFDSPNYYPLGQEWTQAIVAMWGDIGLNVTMSPIDVNQRVLITTAEGWNLFTSGSPSTADTLPQVYGPKGYTRLVFDNAPAGTFDELDAAIDQLDQAIELEEQIAYAKQAYDFLEDFQMVTVLFTINRISASKPNISFQETPLFGLELRPGRFSISS